MRTNHSCQLDQRTLIPNRYLIILTPSWGYQIGTRKIKYPCSKYPNCKCPCIPANKFLKSTFNGSTMAPHKFPTRVKFWQDSLIFLHLSLLIVLKTRIDVSDSLKFIERDLTKYTQNLISNLSASYLTWCSSAVVHHCRELISKYRFCYPSFVLFLFSISTLLYINSLRTRI